MSLRVEDALFKLPSSLHRVLSIGVSLLTEDDASGDEDTNRILSQSDACRGGLYTRLSSVVPWQRNEYGLFTQHALEKGAFVGLYAGDWHGVREYLRLDTRLALDRYAVTTTDKKMVVAPPLGHGGRPDPRLFPLAMMNEPVSYWEANCTIHEVKFVYDELDDPNLTVAEDDQDGEWIGLAMVTCKRVGAGRELTWNYGPSYPRTGYEAGAECSLDERAQRPHTVLVHGIPVSAVGFVPGSAL